MNITRALATIASVSVFSLVGAGYAATSHAAPPPLGTGSSHINSGGTTRPAEGEPKNIPLPDTLEPGGEIIFEAPYGPADSIEVKPAYAVPVAGTVENNAALNNFTSVVGASGAAGTVIGGIGGFIIGCPIGAALGLPLAILPGAIGGCLVGGVAGAGIGAGLGSLAGGGIAGLAAGADVVTTFTAPEGTTHWAQ